MNWENNKSGRHMKGCCLGKSNLDHKDSADN